VTDNVHTEPNVGETIVWQHSRVASKSNKEFSFLGLGPAFWVQVFILMPVSVYKIWMSGGFDFSNGQYWTEARNLKQIAVTGILSLWLLGIIQKFIAKRNGQLDTIIAVPMEMTTTKILINRNDGFGSSEVDIGSIRTAVLDYAEGALAVKLNISSENIILISSEARNILNQLYILRPDLRGAS